MNHLLRAGLACLGIAGLACGDDFPARPTAINPAWSAQIGGPGFQAPTSVTAAGGNIVVGGLFDEGLVVGERALVGAGGMDAAVIAFASAGESSWLDELAGPGDDYVNALASDDAGAVFVAGQASMGATLAGRPCAADFGGALLAKLGTGGEVLWTQLAHGAGFQAATAVAVTRDGGVYFAGDFSAELDIGDGPIRASDDGDAFVARVDGATGAIQWLQVLSGPGVQHAGELAVGADGGAVLIGNFAGELTLAGRTLEGNPISNVTPFVARFRSDGQLLGAQTNIITRELDHTSHEDGHSASHNHEVVIQDLSVAVDGEGRMLTSVSLGSVFGLSGGDFEAPKVDRLNLTRVDVAGIPTDRTQLTAPQSLLQLGRVLGGPGIPEVAASFTGTAVIDDRRLTSQNHRSLLLLDVDPDGTLRAPRTFGIDGVGLTSNDAVRVGDSIIVAAAWTDLVVEDEEIFLGVFQR